MHRRTTRPPQRSSAFGLARYFRTHRSAPGNAGVPPASGAQRRRHLPNVLLALCISLLTTTTTPTLAAGPQTTPVDLTNYTRILHVSTTTGSDSTGTGTPESPYASITQALAATEAAAEAAATASERATNRTAILIAAGTYQTRNLTLKPNVDLYGGFAPTNWSRDIQAHRTILDARAEGRVLTTANTANTTATTNPRLDGLHIHNGLIRGPGGGILIDGTAPVLSNNVFTQNATQTPADWAPKYLHETAHDGGAIYCRNGGAPEIRNNLILANTTETGRGAGIAFDHNCDGLIADNVLIGNIAGTADPMRSSDGGGISIFNHSSPEISGNVVLHNQALHNNDGGGIFVAYWSSAKVRNNVIVANHGGDDGGGLFVGGQEHRYDRPFDPMPSAEDFFVEVTGNRFFGNTNPSRNSGATRITMESRGRVAGNVAALNNGFYLQRSELEVTDNTILEDTLLIETKEGLEPTRFSNNIVTGSLESDGTATVTASLFRDGAAGEGNTAGQPEFLEDGKELQVLGTSYSASNHQTQVDVSALLSPDDLTGRVVVSGNDLGRRPFRLRPPPDPLGRLPFRNRTPAAADLPPDHLVPRFRHGRRRRPRRLGLPAPARQQVHRTPRTGSAHLLRRLHRRLRRRHAHGQHLGRLHHLQRRARSARLRGATRVHARPRRRRPHPKRPPDTHRHRLAAPARPRRSDRYRPAAGWSSRPSPRAFTASTSPAPATPRESSASSRQPATPSTSRPSTC